MRVERERKLIGVDGNATLYAFMPRLEPWFQERCEAARANAAIRRGRQFKWVDVVAIARDDLYGSKFVTKPTGSNPSIVATP